MTPYFRIKNFKKFQHYKDRTPPWIKLHNSIFNDYEFSCLQDASKLQLILIWSLASQRNNELPWNEEWIKGRIGVQGEVDLKALLDKGFIEIINECSNVLATCKQSADVETEAYKQETYKQETENTPPIPPPGGVSEQSQDQVEPVGRAKTSLMNGNKASFDQFWQSYPRKTSKGQARRAWLKLKPNEQLQNRIKLCVERAKTSESWTKDEGKFIPHPATWLNAEGWEDRPIEKPEIKRWRPEDDEQI